MGITVHPDERRRAKEQFDSSFVLRLGVTFMAGVLFMAACGGDADISDTASASIAGPAPALASIAGPPPIPTLTPTIAAPELMPNPVSLSSSYWLGWAGTDCASYGKKPLAFCRAMKDAEIAEPDEVSTGLTAITPHNPDLIWSGIPGQSRVLTVTWSSFVDRTPPESVYDPRNGYRAGKTMMSTRDVFVTIVPELREFCLTSGPFNDRRLRIEQLLGLAPNNGKDSQGNDRAFVELWVDPQDLFRPAPDPEITDHEASLDFPASDRFLTVSEDYIKWFKEFKSISYEETGLPWTRLGYTYDWGNPNSEVGLSEFVVRAEASTKVFSVTPTEEYCQ